MLTLAEKQTLLRLAREALSAGVTGKALSPLDYASLTPSLMEPGASFVTLTIGSELRGCIGALEAYQPLAEDVREHAIAAALQDPRFPPVDSSELPNIHIEISRLTAPQPLQYSSAAELIQKIKPQVDGVILTDGVRRATFLPQVWQSLPQPEEFLARLCQKMGKPANAWQIARLEALTYQVEEFSE